MPDVYVDHHAATPLDPRVLEAMRPYLEGEFGAPTALHGRGRRLSAAVEAARGSVARLLAAEPEEIVFTASAAEANNLVLKGALPARPGGARVLAAATEPLSVLHPLRSLERTGTRTCLVPVDREGCLDLEALRDALRGGADLVSVARASSEIGTLQPTATIAALARAAGVPLHSDASAAAGLVAFAAGARPDFEVIAAHHLGAPAGIAALRVAAGLALRPLVEGGIEEGGLRAGTLPVAAIVGFGRAAELTLAERDARAAAADELAVALRTHLGGRDEVMLTGHPTARIPGHVSLVVRGVEAEALLRGLDEAGIEASSGSACLTGAGKPSHVLLACGVDPALARGAVTFMFGAGNRPGDADRVAEALLGVTGRLRALSPLPDGARS